MITAKSEVEHRPPEKFAEEWSCKTEILSELEPSEKTGTEVEKGTGEPIGGDLN